MEEFRIIIAGGRDFYNLPLVTEKIDNLISIKRKTHKIVIVSGKAKGADTCGEVYAKLNNFNTKEFPVKWIWENGKCINKSAGYKRNCDMADYGHACVCFWDGKSRGTAHMISIAMKRNMPLRVYNYKGVPYEIETIKNIINKS